MTMQPDRYAAGDRVRAAAMSDNGPIELHAEVLGTHYDQMTGEMVIVRWCDPFEEQDIKVGDVNVIHPINICADDWEPGWTKPLTPELEEIAGLLKGSSRSSIAKLNNIRTALRRFAR